MLYLDSPHCETHFALKHQIKTREFTVSDFKDNNFLIQDAVGQQRLYDEPKVNTGCRLGRAAGWNMMSAPACCWLTRCDGGNL